MSLNRQRNQIPHTKYIYENKIIKESIKSVVNSLINSKTPFTALSIKEIQKNEYKRDLSKILVIKLLKEELNLGYK